MTQLQSSDSRMLAAVVSAQRSQFSAMAEAWLASGATTFSIWAEGTLLGCWPQASFAGPPSMKAAIQVNGREIGEIQVAGLSGPAAEAVLLSEAGLVARLARMEKEIKGMTARLIDTQDQLLAVYDLTEATRNYLDMGDLLNQLAFKTTQLGTTEGAAFLLELPGQELRLEHYPQPFLDETLLRSSFEKVKTTENELVLNFSESEMALSGLRNLLLMPIQVRGEICSALALINKREGDFLSPDTKLARVIASHAGSRIEHLLLYQESLEQAKLQVEADLAQQVQLNLLPKTSPQIDGLDLWAGSRPASQVGGDFYDFVSSRGRPFTFAVGDVSGKGMPAALLMAMTRTVMRTKTNVDPTPTPEVILNNCNTELYDDFTEVSMFATAFIGQFHPQNRQLLFANAGHSPVIFCPHEGEARLLEADGTALGVLPTSLSKDQEIAFGEGDVLVVATDGFSEATNGKDELFGYERLMKVIEKLAVKSAREVVEGLFETVNQYSAGLPQADDQTVIVIKGN